MAENKLKKTIEEKDEAKKISMEFAKKLENQVINDPTGKTSKRENKSYSTPTKDSIEKALQSPSQSEQVLRNNSIYLYQINTRYRSIITYYANLPSWIYTILPVNFNPDKVKPENFKKQYQKVCSILESMTIPKMMREIVTTGLREGAYYGCIWGGDGNNFILQKLNADNCVITTVSDGGVFNFAYDMSKVKEEDLGTHYPPQFTDMFNAYKRTSEKYQEVPADIGVCFKADPTIPEYSIPLYGGTLPTLFQIENLKALAETSEELSNYKLLAALLPVNDEGVPIMDYDLAMQYYRHISNNIGDRVGLAISPFKIDDFSFDQSGTNAQIDIVARASENYFAEAGTSALLHGATNATSGVTKLAIKVDEGIAFGFMYQCESIINRFLKLLSGTVKFKIHFLEITAFNRDEKISEYKNAMNYGMCKLEYLAAMGIHQADVIGENYIEQNILDIDNLFTPMKTASTRSADEDSNEGGRPTLSDDEISDEGEATRDGDADDNR